MGCAGVVSCFAFGGNGAWLVSGDARGSLTLWAAAAGTPLHARPGAHRRRRHRAQIHGARHREPA